jgi:26S proteasome regulatory subunit N7
MAPYYRFLTSTSELAASTSIPTSPPTNTSHLLPFDQQLYDEMAAKNKEELESFDKRLEEAEKTEGESDVADLLRGKAMYLVKIGDRVCCVMLRSGLLLRMYNNLGYRKRHYQP